jgi:hypothetical protein
MNGLYEKMGEIVEDRERCMRTLEKALILAGMRIYHNFVKPSFHVAED